MAKKVSKAQERFVSTSKGTTVVGKMSPKELAKLTKRSSKK